MNYMKEVVKMLGVELEEEFLISNTGLTYKFVDNGLLQKHIPIGTWHYDNNMLRCLLSGEYEIVKKPILDEVEKRYLNNVIKPFRSRVKYIVKRNENKSEYFEGIRVVFESRYMTLYFPYFEKGTMYKGMELNKEYSLEELGL